MKKNELDFFWMNRAIFLAKNAELHNEVPVGCVLIFKNMLIAEGWNKSILNNDPCGHAEILVLRMAGKIIKNYRLLKSTIYVTLEPCVMCVGALINARIFRLVFGANNKKMGAVGSIINILDFFKKTNILISKGILKKECSGILSDFFKRKRIKNQFFM